MAPNGCRFIRAHHQPTGNDGAMKKIVAPVASKDKFQTE